MEDPISRVGCREHWQFRPAIIMQPVESHPRVLLAGRNLHPAKPVDLPHGFFEEVIRCAVVRELVPEVLEGRKEDGGRYAAAHHVLSVVTGIVPAARNVDPPVERPARIEPARLVATPASHRRIASVRTAAYMAGLPAVSGIAIIRDRAAGSLQVEEVEGVAKKWDVDARIHVETMAGPPGDGRTQAAPRRVQLGELEKVQPKSGDTSYPRVRALAGKDDCTCFILDLEAERLFGVDDAGCRLGPSGR